LQLKVYLAKVYDYIKWSFIHNALMQIGDISANECLVGGARSNFFMPKCGIWQEHTMSPYLFVLV